jgi:transposase
MPNFCDGRPPKLDAQQQDQLFELLRDGQLLKKQEIQHLINDEFNVSLHPVYLLVFLEKLGLSCAIPRTKRPSRPDNAEEILDEHAGNGFNKRSNQPHNKREGDDQKGGSSTMILAQTAGR